MRAYKFLNSSDLPKVRNDGTLWLASAADVRKTEKSAAGYGDPDELARRWKAPTGSRRVDQNDAFARGLGLTVNRPVTFEFEEGVEFHIITDGLMFCATLDRSDETIRRMREEFGYDASFSIRDFHALGRALARQFPKDVSATDVVDYADIDPASDAMLERSSFTKAAVFAWQKEVRFICAAAGAGRAVKVPGLWRYIDTVRLH